MVWTLTRPETGEINTFDVRPVYTAAAGGWVVNGMTYPDPDGDRYVLTPPTTLVIDVPTFIMRFHPTEELAARASQDDIIKLFLRRLDDPRVKNVNLAHPSVQGAVMYMALNAEPPPITPDRVAEILAPEPLA
jgi:hypothetical protein